MRPRQSPTSPRGWPTRASNYHDRGCPTRRDFRRVGTTEFESLFSRYHRRFVRPQNDDGFQQAPPSPSPEVPTCRKPRQVGRPQLWRSMENRMQGCRPAPFTGLSARFGMTSFFRTDFTSSIRRLRAGLSCDIVRELLCLRLSNPALKRRAIVGRPYGTGASRGVSCLRRALAGRSQFQGSGSKPKSTSKATDKRVCSTRARSKPRSTSRAAGEGARSTRQYLGED